MPEKTTFIPGISPTESTPLARFLPILSRNVVTNWLKTAVTPGTKSNSDRSWILDPFGSSPQIVVEAAQAGCCVLVTVVNPITRHLIRMIADPPSQEKLKSSIAALGASYRGSTRLELDINRLYKTQCADCESWTTADAFVWDRDLQVPIKRIYACDQCGASGEFTATQQDIELANQLSSPLHRARALERAAHLHDPDRAHVQRVMEMYLDRALYALISLINKLEIQSEENQEYLYAILISVFDRASKLWHYPLPKDRPRQLTIPAQFFEFNIWRAIDTVITEWSRPGNSSIPITCWPELPPEQGGICIYEGRLKDFHSSVLSNMENKFEFDGVILAYPRPNQAFWSFSALWSGWLFDQEETAAFKPVLRRRRYDWGWHTNAILSTTKLIKDLVSPSTPILGYIGELETGYLSASIIANELAGLSLTGIAIREDIREAQLHLHPEEEAESDTIKLSKDPQFQTELIQVATESSLAYLRQRAEPAKYIQIHTTALLDLINQVPLSKISHKSVYELYNQVNQIIENAIVKNPMIFRFQESEHSLEIGEWWLSSPKQPTGLTISDRVELECIQYLRDNPSCKSGDLDTHLCAFFPGLLTPNRKFVYSCLSSYGELIDEDRDLWHLNPQDGAQARRSDLEQIRELIRFLGERLALESTSNSENEIHWRDHNNQILNYFILLTSAIITPIIYSETYIPAKSIIVVPGSRASLISYRSRHDPRIKAALENGWRFIKFRHIRRLADEPNLTLENFDQKLQLDPLKRDDPQLPLL